jgi:hypothetical protein
LIGIAVAEHEDGLARLQNGPGGKAKPSARSQVPVDERVVVEGDRFAGDVGDLHVVGAAHGFVVIRGLVVGDDFGDFNGRLTLPECERVELAAAGVFRFFGELGR